MLPLPEEFYLNIAHLQCVDVVAIRRNFIRRGQLCTKRYSLRESLVPPDFQ
jgi:hypothetical protein